MKLFIVERIDNVDYDQYDSIVVAAMSAKSAKQVKPFSKNMFGSWAKDETDLVTTEIGYANDSIKTPKILHESFRAG